MIGRVLILLLFSTLLQPTGSHSQSAAPHPLTIDDVLDMQRIDRASLSLDGEWAAVSVQRPARAGEAYGRAAYETDPSRNDVWLVSTRTGEKRALTDGSPQAAGYWCATWSPDGRRLAMLSTQPEGREPRGGDNVRLYVWDRATGAITRMSDAAMMTQTRYGSGIDKLDLRGGADGGTVAHDCGYDENAPFLWLDADRLLITTIPAGQVSGLLDQYGRPFREDTRNAALLRDGSAPTVRVAGSGAERQPRDENNSAILQTLDVTTHRVATIATVPAYPFRSALTVSVSPDRKRLAILATLGAIQPQAAGRGPNVQNDEWTVERRLGFADLAPGAPVLWVTMPAEGGYPVDLYGWSPDSRRVALRGRAGSLATATPLFVATADGKVKRLGATSVGEDRSGADVQHQPPVLWIDNDRLVARLTDVAAKPPSDWWILGIDGKASNVTRGKGVFPSGFWRASDGHLITFAEEQLFRLDLARATLVPVVKLPGASTIFWPADPGAPAAQFLVGVVGKDSGAIRTMTADGKVGPPFQPPGSSINVTDLSRGTMLWSQTSQKGLALNATRVADNSTRELLRLDDFMANVAWGKFQLIDYAGTDGKPLKGLVILPPDYQPGRRYPTLSWIYDGYVVRGLDDPWADPFMPGIYNLQLYAARGYVVLVPSQSEEAERDKVYANVPKGVMPAIDKLVELGITDPDRLGVFGQSFGGYSTYAIISQTNRFKAAVAMAGLTDLTSNYGVFDPTARGYPGIEHEKGDNWSIDQWGRRPPPPGDPAGYWSNSPLAYADRVETPLLMIHGEFDIRGGSGQAEEFFTALFRRGKTAKLLRYGGESHSLAQSPANVRDIYAQTIAWFDKYLKKKD